jgi:hypothetical protein
MGVGSCWPEVHKLHTRLCMLSMPYMASARQLSTYTAPPPTPSRRSDRGDVLGMLTLLRRQNAVFYAAHPLDGGEERARNTAARSSH